MKFLLMVLALFVAALFAGPIKAEPKKSPAEMTEAEFKAHGPRLYSMADAKAVGKLEAKPVACWVGKNLFSLEDARVASDIFADTTVQAAMDRQGTKQDDLGPRLVFTSNSYSDNATEFYVLAKDLHKFKNPENVRKALAAMRGGK